jgi:hypothetical protein
MVQWNVNLKVQFPSLCPVPPDSCKVTIRNRLFVSVEINTSIWQLLRSTAAAVMMMVRDRENEREREREREREGERERRREREREGERERDRERGGREISSNHT